MNKKLIDNSISDINLALKINNPINQLLIDTIVMFNPNNHSTALFKNTSVNISKKNIGNDRWQNLLIQQIKESINRAKHQSNA